MQTPRPPTLIGGGDPDGFLRSIEQYAKLGISLVGLAPGVAPDPVAYVRGLEPLVPRLAAIGS